MILLLAQELKKYKEITKKENYDENKLFELFDKEYDEIFNTKEYEDENPRKNEIGKFLNDFPYNIIIKKRFEDKEEILLFDGNNDLDNLKQFKISKDEDPITNLLEEIESNEYALFLVFKSKSVYSLHNIKLDACETIDGPDFNKKEQLILDNLLEFFCSDEYLDKDNE